MTNRYCDKSEEMEIIELYKTGEFSYNQIGEMKNLSKGTIINIVKGYPYCQDRQAYYDRLQTESADRLEQEIVATKEKAQAAHDRGNISAYGLHTRQWLTLLDMVEDRDHVYERLKDERISCEQKAWDGFANGNYSEFGFYADTWELLTTILGDNAKNPWGSIAKESNAKDKSKSIRFTKIQPKGQNVNFTAIVATPSHFCLSEQSWQFIRPLVIGKETGRPSDHRRVMEGIIYALGNCRSFRSVPGEYGGRFAITDHFAKWYRRDIFADLLMFVSVCPELAPVKAVLLQIEKHRLMYGDSVPRLCDIRRGVEGEKSDKNCT
jgi:transposase